MTGSKLDQINIIASDVERTAQFYALLGLCFPRLAKLPDGHAFHLSSQAGDGALLEADSPRFAQAWNEAWKGHDDLAGRIVVGLRLPTRVAVDEKVRSVVEAGYRVLQPPYDAFWGARYAIVEDPDGVAVGLMSPADGPHTPPPSF